MSSKTFLWSILLPSHQKDFYLTGFSPHRIFTSQDFLFRQVLGAVQRLPPGASLASTSKSGSLSQDDLTCLIREDLKLIVPFQDTSSLLLWRCKAGPLVEAPGPGPPQVHPLVHLQVLQYQMVHLQVLQVPLVHLWVLQLLTSHAHAKESVRKLGG